MTQAAGSNARVSRWITAAVFLVALATLLFEVLLTRIFAVTLWYHFGFLAISLALLGTATSAVLCFLYPQRLAGEHHARYMRRACYAMAVLAPAAVFVHLGVVLPPPTIPLAFYLIFSIQLLLLFGAFFASGLCISIALFRYASEISTVYFFDLVGAALGSLLVVPLMYQLSGTSLVFLVAAFASLGAWAAGQLLDSRRIHRHIALIPVGLALVLLANNDDWGVLSVRVVKAYEHGQMQIGEPKPLYEKWSPVSRVTVFPPVRSPDGEVAWLFADAGAPTVLRRFDGDFSKLQQPLRDPRQAAHSLKSGADVLIIGSAGGTDVLASLFFKQKSVTAVEINPVTAQLVQHQLSEYIGRLFEDPRVKLHVQEGRNFVAGSRDKYDIIQITMIDSWAGAAAGSYIFNENSLYTDDALNDYLAHLKSDGVLSITRYWQFEETTRLVNMIAANLERRGLTQLDRRIVVIKEGKKGYGRATVLLKNGLFTAPEVEQLRTVVQRTNAQFAVAPFVEPGAFERSKTAALLRALVDPRMHGTTRQGIVSSHARDIRPPTDDRPFFFFTSRLGDAFRSDPSEHPARRTALPLLYGMTAFFMLIAILTVVLPLYVRSRKEIRAAPYRTRSLVYFSMLGVGFMLIEISLIQRLTVFLGHPTWSFVAVLSTMLFASGLGSAATARWKAANPEVLIKVLALITVTGAVYALFIYDLFIGMMSLTKPARVALAVAVMLPPGFLMGMCFPLGIQIIRRFHETLVPWAWGINGVFSVFGSIFAVVLAMNVGFKAAFLVGVTCYLVALLIVASLRGKVTPEP